MEFLKVEKVPVAYIGIGPVHKRDVMKASIQMDKDRKYGVMLAFDVPVDRDAQVPFIAQIPHPECQLYFFFFSGLICRLLVYLA